MRPHLDSDEIPHTPRGNKQRRLFPKNLRRAFLQPINRRIFSVNVVPNFRLRHGAPHLCRGPRHRVASQVHHSIRNLPRLRHLIRIYSLIPLRHRVAHFPSAPSLCRRLPRPGRGALLVPSTKSSSFRTLRSSAFSATLHYLFFSIPHLISSTNTSFETLSFS